jgi:hypothetical protein
MATRVCVIAGNKGDGPLGSLEDDGSIQPKLCRFDRGSSPLKDKTALTLQGKKECRAEAACCAVDQIGITFRAKGGA